MCESPRNSVEKYIMANKKGRAERRRGGPQWITHHQKTYYVPEVIGTVLIKSHHNDQLARDSRIEKSCELVGLEHQPKLLHCFPSF